MSKPKLIKRYGAAERLNHWIVAVCFIVLAFSGLALFYPAFFWFTGVFGTPQLARIVHPFVGLIFFVGFTFEFFRFWRRNLINKEDIKWMKAVKSTLKGHEVGDIGKYNGGQKMMFWAMTGCTLVMIVTGIIMWWPWFAGYFPIPLIRLALLFHAWSALILIACIIVHIYAAIWVKGTIPAMVEGTVTEAWAKKHHPRWYREVKAAQAQSEDRKPD